MMLIIMEIRNVEGDILAFSECRVQRDYNMGGYEDTCDRDIL